MRFLSSSLSPLPHLLDTPPSMETWSNGISKPRLIIAPRTAPFSSHLYTLPMYGNSIFWSIRVLWHLMRRFCSLLLLQNVIRSLKKEKKKAGKDACYLYAIQNLVLLSLHFFLEFQNLYAMLSIGFSTFIRRFIFGFVYLFLTWRIDCLVVCWHSITVRLKLFFLFFYFPFLCHELARYLMINLAVQVKWLLSFSFFLYCRWYYIYFSLGCFDNCFGRWSNILSLQKWFSSRASMV